MTEATHNPTNVPDAAPNRRDAAKAAHSLALDAWYEAILADMVALADSMDVRGPGLAFVFHGMVPAGFSVNDYECYDCEGPDLEDTLGHVVISNGADEVLVDVSIGVDVWGECVDVWGALREAFSVRFRSYTGPGLLVDVDAKAAAVWSPLYCPDEGPDPDAILDFSEPDTPADPFAELLRNVEEDLDKVEQRLLGVLDQYNLDAPSAPAHAAGDCPDID